MHFLSAAIFAHADEVTPEAIEGLMAPYQETYNLETKELTGYWDWYQVGGRWDKEWGPTNVLPVLDVISACETGSAIFPHTIFTPDGVWEKQDLNPYLSNNPAEDEGWWERQQKLDEVEWPARCRQLLTTLATLDAVAVLIDCHC